MELQIISCFDIGKVSRSPGNWNLHWLSFLTFIFIFKQCVLQHQYFRNTPTDRAHFLYRFLDIKKLATSNLAFQAFEGFIGT